MKKLLLIFLMLYSCADAPQVEKELTQIEESECRYCHAIFGISEKVLIKKIEPVCYIDEIHYCVLSFGNASDDTWIKICAPCEDWHVDDIINISPQKASHMPFIKDTIEIKAFKKPKLPFDLTGK